MSRNRTLPLIFVFLLLSPLAASAASYLVPTDGELIEASDAVVIGTVLSSMSRYAPGGLIVTDHAIRVDETLKGRMAEGATIRVTEVGGVVGEIGLVSSSAPRYVWGERALIMLDALPDGSYTTHAGQLGKFNFVRDARSALLLVRGARDEEIFGWDVHGAPHVERTRDAAAFLDFPRRVARGARGARSGAQRAPFSSPRDLREDDYFRAPEGDIAIDSVIANADFSPNAYLMQFGFANPGGARWPTGGFTMGVQGTPSGTTAAALAQIGASTWNGDPTSSITITISGSASSIIYGRSDDANVINFGVPPTFTYKDDDNQTQTPLSGNVVGQALLWATSEKHDFRGESFYTSAECDIIIESSLSGSVLSEVTAHEMGHCLGLRHSNEGAPPNTTNALMNSSATGRGARLEDWDREAANAVYGDGTYNLCIPPQIANQTASRTIASGQSLTLSVSATGTNLTYQWYRGSAGDESQPITGATSGTLATGPMTSPASYWAKIGGACGSASTTTITVTVSPESPSPRRRTVKRG